MKLTPNFLENLELADIVRGSHEDFDVMFHTTDPDMVYRSQISFYCKKFICTCGSEPLELRADGGFKKQYPVQQVDVVGITRSMVIEGLSETQWDALICSAQQFSMECCKSINNSVSVEFGAARMKELNQ